MPVAEEISAWENYETAGTKQARNLHQRRRSVQVGDGVRRSSARVPSAGGRQMGQGVVSHVKWYSRMLYA